MKAYPHKCKRCHSSSRNMDGVSLCSNVKCKGRSKVIKALGKYGVALKMPTGTKGDPIPVICSVCGVGVSSCTSDQHFGLCASDGYFPFIFEREKFYVFTFLDGLKLFELGINGGWCYSGLWY